ncbi:MAG: hypothetical protein AB7E29_13875 [Xanthobacter sp.]
MTDKQDTQTTAIPEGYHRYTVGEYTYDLPDDMPENEVLTFLDSVQISEGQEEAEQGPTTPKQGEKTWSETVFGRIDPDDLQYDKPFVQAGRTLWEYHNGKSSEGVSDKELSEYALSRLGWFQYNLGVMGVQAGQVASAPDEYKKAFLHILNVYDDLEFSMGGLERFAKGAATDPTTYFGIASFGAGTAAAQGTKVTTIAALKQLLKQSLKAGVTMGVEGAAYGAASNVAEQIVRIEGGEREGFSGGELAGSALIGGALGTGLGAVAHGAGSVVKGALPANGMGKASKQIASPVPANAEPVVSPATSPEGSVLPAPEALAPVDAPQVKTTANPTLETEPSYTDLYNDDVPWNKVSPDVTPSVPPLDENPIVKAVNDHAPDAGMRVKQDLANGSKPATDTILSLDDASLSSIIDDARKAELRGESNSLLKAAFADATQEVMTRLKNEPDLGKAWELNKRLGSIRDADLALSSDTGSSLAYRKGNLNTGDMRSVSVESILEEKGINPSLATTAERETALVEFQARLNQRDAVLTQNRQVQELAEQAEKAADAGDLARAIELNHQKNVIMDALAEAQGDDRSLLRKTADRLLNSRPMNLLHETFLSNVMSPATLVVNVVPMAVRAAYKPGLDVVAQGFSKRARYRAAASYNAYATAQKYALQAAKAAFDYETTLLGKASDMVDRAGKVGMGNKLEFTPAIPGRTGRVIRTIPRLLTTTDEYFSQLTYRSFVAGEVAARAYDEAAEQGLKGKALRDFVEAKVSRYEEHAFRDMSHDSVLDFLRKQGVKRGLTGPKLETFIRTQYEKNRHLFKEAIDNVGMNYTDDVAFRRDFSGSNWASGAAKWYADGVNQFPVLKVIGQLFFKTPVRVFEQGLRLTMGANLLSPGGKSQFSSFIRDLSGKGPGGIGGHAQIKAQGEAMLSAVLASSAVTLFATGRITGAGPGEDWRQGRSMKNPDFEPYTVDLGNGVKFNYRNLDPFTTPLKIIANTLERMEMLDYRKAQGEDVSLMENEAMAYLYTGAYGLITAVKDASLFEGMGQFVDLLTAASDADNEQNSLARFVNQKLVMFIPSTIGKTVHAFSGDGSMPDPASLEQAMTARINPYSAKVPRIYDPMGFPLTRPQGLGAYLGLQFTDREERSSGNEKVDTVRKALAELTVQTGQNWIASYKASNWASGFGLKGQDYDLRLKTVSDGSGQTMYDRLQQYVAESDMVDDLYDLLTTEDTRADGGTPSDKGFVTKAVQVIFRAYRAEAFARLMDEEEVIQQKNDAEWLKLEGNRWNTGEQGVGLMAPPVVHR